MPRDGARASRRRLPAEHPANVPAYRGLERLQNQVDHHKKGFKIILHGEDLWIKIEKKTAKKTRYCSFRFTSGKET